MDIHTMTTHILQMYQFNGFSKVPLNNLQISNIKKIDKLKKRKPLK